MELKFKKRADNVPIVSIAATPIVVAALCDVTVMRTDRQTDRDDA